MGLRNTTPLYFSPSGITDALDSTNAPAGAMQALVNLIPDPTTKNLYQCRPAAFQIYNFAAFNTPRFVSLLAVFGDLAVGMIATARNSGKDEPFVFNLRTGNNVTVSGVTSGNSPLSQAQLGAWTPPICDIVGTKVIVTHPGFDGVTNMFGVLDLSNPSAPAWSAGNTTGTPLPAKPVSVCQFGQRAWFVVNPVIGQPGTYFSDVLAPTVITNANQVLTYGDNVPLTTAFGLPLTNQLGGIVQSLMVFKDSQNIFQVTGDYALNTLAVNALNVATGTAAPNSLAHTPKGIIFLAPDGLRLINFDANVSDPIGEDGQGINVPFLYLGVPSRVCTASTADILRVTTQTPVQVGPGQPFSTNQEWWLDLTRQRWSGPHTFPASLIQAYKNTFIMTPVGITGSLWQSDPSQNANSGFTENGNPMQYTFLTSMLPNTKDMSQHSMIESSIMMQMSAGDIAVVFGAYDENLFPYDQVTIVPFGSAAIWGNFNWGQAQWGATNNALYPRKMPWRKPITFQRLAIGVNGACSNAIKIGDLLMRYEKLGYLEQDQGPLFTTFNPINTGPRITLSNSNQTATADATGNDNVVIGNRGRYTGKFYFELVLNLLNSGYPGIAVSAGVALSSVNLTSYLGNSPSASWGYIATGNKINNNSISGFGAAYTTADIIGVAIDLDAGNLWFSKNGTFQAGGVPGSGTNPAFTGVFGVLFPAADLVASGRWTLITQIGSLNFTPPPGFSAWT